jgi:2-keto-3-deoxy-L-rhamnonate aldolase RhmA
MQQLSPLADHVAQALAFEVAAETVFDWLYITIEIKKRDDRDILEPSELFDAV